MPSTLGWIDYSASHYEGVKRALEYFRERESRDELGLGAIRDSVAEKLFPGTSTLQTRLRYILFVPWIYQRLEAQQTAAADVATKARRLELELIEPLCAADPNGVIGKIARNSLKLLPSSIYWAGLASWGVLRFPRSQSDYHRAFDRIVQHRAARRRREDVDAFEETISTWHAALPEAPDGFPKAASFALTPDEAEYLRDRIRESHPDSLLGWLASEDLEVPQVEHIWLHPHQGRFRSEHRELIQLARVFAEVMHGAAILYNLELDRARSDREQEDERREMLSAWVQKMESMHGDVIAFDLERFLEAARVSSHVVTVPTRIFVTDWFEVARRASLSEADSERARNIIRSRERSLKRGNSRFANPAALAQWSGWSGLAIMNFRWFTASRLLADLHAGLARKEY